MADIVILQDEQGKSFEVRPGSAVAIRLSENPTTGYQWEAAAVDESVLEAEGSDYQVGSGAGVGGGGTRTFFYRAVSPGTVKIELVLRRSWEPEEEAIDRFEVTVRVGEA